MSNLHDLPWVIASDFNEVLSVEEKFGGKAVDLRRALRFQDCLNYWMIDLGFFGSKFTWSNNQPLTHLIQERIDRVFVNPAWNELHPEACVKHLERSHFDHCPVILSLHQEAQLNIPRSFRFQPMWLSHHSFPGVVMEARTAHPSLPTAVTTFTNKAKEWNKNNFENVFQQERRICARLEGIQFALANHPSRFLVNLVKTLRAEYKAIIK